MVVLKPLSQALADGDRIHAVIRATAVNQDGRTTTITVPSSDAQIAMLREACAESGVRPVEIDYVEAHGTGTAVGDPIEARRSARCSGSAVPRPRPCAIGSIKTNIGHLEPAAGIAGLIKAALCVRDGQMPPNLHFQIPIQTSTSTSSAFASANSLRRARRRCGSRFAAVNSFGFGGTNACAIVQQPPRAGEPAPGPASKPRGPLRCRCRPRAKAALAATCGRPRRRARRAAARLCGRGRHAGAAPLAPRSPPGRCWPGRPRMPSPRCAT